MKSLRGARATIAESYVSPERGEIWLINANIPEYLQANRFNHDPKRPRKLLLNKKQISRLFGAVEREGMTIVPLKLYFNERGMAKVEIALAQGKKLHDKRETREEARLGAGEGPAHARQGLRLGHGRADHRPRRCRSARMPSNTASNISVVSTPVFVL